MWIIYCSFIFTVQESLSEKTDRLSNIQLGFEEKILLRKKNTCKEIVENTLQNDGSCVNTENQAHPKHNFESIVADSNNNNQMRYKRPNGNHSESEKPDEFKVKYCLLYM